MLTLAAEAMIPEVAQGWIQTLGFPIAMVLVLLAAMMFAARAIKGWIDAKDQQSQEREDRMSKRLDFVQDEFSEFQKTTARDCAAAMNRLADIGEDLKEQGQETKTLILQTNETMRDVRRELMGSSDRRKAV